MVISKPFKTLKNQNKIVMSADWMEGSAGREE
jgi:hypothetical protein